LACFQNFSEMFQHFSEMLVWSTIFFQHFAKCCNIFQKCWIFSEKIQSVSCRGRGGWSRWLDPQRPPPWPMAVELDVPGHGWWHKELAQPQAAARGVPNAATCGA
jgi:hypothetical protein